MKNDHGRRFASVGLESFELPAVYAEILEQEASDTGITIAGLVIKLVIDHVERQERQLKLSKAEKNYLIEQVVNYFVRYHHGSGLADLVEELKEYLENSKTWKENC